MRELRLIQTYLFRAVTLSVVTLFCISTSIHANYIGDVLYNPASNRSQAMGGVFVTSVDASSVFANPGSLALFHREQRFGVVFQPQLEEPNSFFDLNSRQIGFSTGRNISSSKHSDQIIAIGLSNNHHNFGEIERRTFDGTITGVFDNTGESSNLTVSYAYFKRVKFGFGVRYKRAKLSNLAFYNTELTTNWFDAGILLSIPIILSEDPIVGRSNSSKTPDRMVLDYSFGVTLRDIGKEFHESSTFDYYPVQTRWVESPATIGLALKLARVVEGLDEYSITGAFESTILLGSQDDNIDAVGIEVGVYEILFLRAGASDYLNQESMIPSFGFGLSSAGLLKHKQRRNNDKNGPKSIWERLDLEVSVATLGGDLKQTGKTYGVTLSLRR